MEGLELRVVIAPTDALRASVTSLLERAEAVRHHAPLSEHKRMVLARNDWGAAPGSDQQGAVGPVPAFGVVVVRPGRSTPVGYTQVSGDPGRGEYAAELVVDPDLEGAAAVAGAMVGAVTEHVAGHGGGTVRLWRPQAAESDDILARGHGFRRERDLVQMRCPLPIAASTAAADDLLPTRPFRPGQDEVAWLATNNRAFASHPEQGHWDLETLLEREREEWFDPGGFLVLEVQGRLGGSCWTKVHAHTTPPMGEIYVISVDPDFHGRGWGRGLTRAGLDWLAGQGLRVGMLYVDADNVPAVSLYRSMGFTEDHVDRSYVRTVR